MRDDYNYKTGETTTFAGVLVFVGRATGEIFYGGKWWSEEERAELREQIERDRANAGD